MPTVRNHEGDVHVRGYGRFAGGASHDVDRETAEYLTANRDFTVVKDDAVEPDSTTPDGDVEPDSTAEAIDAGECPWCGSEFENVAAHASQAHKEEWAAYQEDAE